MCNTLYLPLKKKWFDKIKSGEKVAEYREIKPYYVKRFCYGPFHLFKRFEKIVFTLGYPKANDKSRRMEFKNPIIFRGTGNPKMGAEPGKEYFVIYWDNK